MELENLLKAVINLVNEQGASGIEEYNLNLAKGIDFELNGKAFDIRIIEK